MNTINTFSGHSNQGFQQGANYGQVYVNFNERSPTKPTPSSTVPFRRDPDFIDRDILAEVGKKCSKPASRTALIGLGGVGKSQLAIEYSYRIREQFPQTWIFWVHASNTARFEEGYRVIADRVKLLGREEPKVDILQLVCNWLSDEANGRWIMILDNADDSAMFSDPREGRLRSDIPTLVGRAKSLSYFLPQTPNGSILVTSRSKDAALSLTGSHHDIIKVEPMDEDRALLLFEKKLEGGFDKDDAIELSRALDHMPLAINQAAAYISQRAPRTSVARYLADFRKSDRNRANLLNRDPRDLRRDNEASNSIITTWQISFEYIREKSPSAARLLSLMSFFDRQGIPKFLLHGYNDRKDGSDIDWDNMADLDLEDNDIKFEDDIFTLTSYSLITNTENDQFEMHRLVQFSTRKWLELNNELEQWNNKYIQTISKVFPTGDYENWTLCQVLFPHTEALLRPVEKKYLIYWSEVLDKAGFYATLQGNYLTAEEMSRRALKEREETLGEKHSDTLTSVSNLARVLQEQGKYEAAEEMNQRALDGREKTLGKEHPETLTSVSNLAWVLTCRGEYEAAERMNRRALDGREKTLGKEHPDTLTSVSNLAWVLKCQGKYEAVEEMIQRALDGYENVLGKEHPYTLASVSNLAEVLQDQGKYETAEEMLQRALDGCEKALGKEHPDTLTSVSNLAEVLTCRREYEAAEGMNRRALDGREKTLGKEHPDTLTSVSNLAAVLQEQGKYEAAEEMNQRVLDGYEKALGKEHPSTLTSVYNFAYLLHRQKQYRDATALYERACSGFEKVFGLNHPTSRACSSNYSSMIEEMKAYQSPGAYGSSSGKKKFVLRGLKRNLTSWWGGEKGKGGLERKGADHPASTTIQIKQKHPSASLSIPLPEI